MWWWLGRVYMVVGVVVVTELSIVVYIYRLHFDCDFGQYKENAIATLNQSSVHHA